jgi:hypothetical protein
MLFGLKPSDVGTPLSQFQATQFNQNDVLKLLKSINSEGEDGCLSETRLEKMHNALWPELSEKIDPIISSIGTVDAHSKKKEEVDLSKILEEILVLSRRQASMFHNPEMLLSPDLVAMIMDVAADRGLSSPNQRRLEMIARALDRHWSELTANMDVDGPEGSIALMKGHLDTVRRIGSIIEDLSVLVRQRRWSGEPPVRGMVYRDKAGRIMRHLPDENDQNKSRSSEGD